MRLLAAAFATALLAPALSAAPIAELWEKNCIGCHGDDGKGKTRLGRKAGAKDLTDKAYQARTTDEAKAAIIRDGLKNKKGDEVMEGYGDRLSAAEISALVAYVKAFAK